MGSHETFVNSRFELMKVALTPAPTMISLPNKYNDMRRGVQVSFGKRNPTRDTGTVQRVCGLCINLYRTNFFLALLNRIVYYLFGTFFCFTHWVMDVFLSITIIQ